MAKQQPQPVSSTELEQHIQQDIKSCEILLQLLHAERDALKERQLDLLEDIIQNKAEHLLSLEKSANLRAQWLADPQAASATLEQRWATLLAKQAPHLQPLWQKLRDLLQTCQSENEVNGKMLGRSQQTLNRVLGLLRGQDTSPNLYSGKKNQKHSERPGQHLGEA